MDDLQFRRRIYADPKSQDKDILSAQAEDPKKKALAQTLIDLDNKLNSALNIPVPEGLYDKLILRQTMSNHQQQKRRSRVYLSLAASVAIVAGVMVNLLMFTTAHSNLGDYALAHVHHEEAKFSNQDKSVVSLASLNQKMATFEGNFTSSIGKLMSADYCRFDGMKSLHLVYQGLTSPVTIFIVPKNEQLAFTKAFNDSNLQGESIAYQHSNIIIVADKNESLSLWQQRVSENISI